MSIEIARAGLERLEDVGPLWISLQRHHAEVAPELRVLGEARSGEDSWRLRRANYEGWLGEPGAFLMIASEAGSAVGYALVRMRGPSETWASDELIAELETLAVLPAQRSRGIGTALVEEVNRELERSGIRQLSVTVIASNANAIRFYERLGLTRFTVSYVGDLD
jgi:ribosomal protein S18 acetylase RimI-like enzyme